jgi:hypothetical protein
MLRLSLPSTETDRRGKKRDDKKFPLPSGERIKVRGKSKHKKSGFLQVIGFHLLVNILCNQNGEEP